MDNLTKLKHLAISDKSRMINFGRALLASDPDLHAWVIEQTPFLQAGGNFNERVYCLVHGITEEPKCRYYGKPLIFEDYTNGYKVISRGPIPTVPYRIDHDPLSAAELTHLMALGKEYSSHPMRLIQHDIELFDKVLATTIRLEASTFAERLYCLVHGIVERPSRAFKGYSKGYGQTSTKKVVNQELLDYARRVGSKSTTHGSKVKQFLRRNKQVNGDLYELPESELGVSFVECPVLGVRMLNLKRPYVDGVLLMKWDEFIAKHPDVPLSCTAHRQGIAKGLTVLGEDGVSAHARSVSKSKVTKKLIGEDGLTVNQRKGRKTRDTHLSNVDENGLNGYQRIAIVARPKQLRTMAKAGNRSASEETRVFVAYRNLVTWLTAPKRDDLLEGRKTGKAGTDGAYHVDHIYSVIHGFNNKISPWCIAHIGNLRVIPWEENVRKSFKSDISIQELFDRTSYECDQSELEFDGVIEAIGRFEASEQITSGKLIQFYNTIREDGANIREQRPI